MRDHWRGFCGSVLLMMMVAVSVAAEPATDPSNAPSSGPSTQPADPWDGALAVDVRVEPGTYQVGDQLLLKVRILNKSKNVQKFMSTICGWSQEFETNKPLLTSEKQKCSANAITPVVLPAGEAWEKRLKVNIAKDLRPGVATFKVGFKALDVKTTLWSEDVQVEILPAK